MPRLANINSHALENDNDQQVFLYIDTLARALESSRTFVDEKWVPVSPRAIEERIAEKYEVAISATEQNLEWLCFTSQNV